MDIPIIDNEKRKFSHDMQLNAERLEMILDGSELGFWDWNIETGNVTRNDRWAQILGYSTIKELGDSIKTWSDLIHPDDSEMAWASINNHKDGHTSGHKMEYRMLTKSGEYKWILDHAKVTHHDDHGRAIRMIGTHSDISGRRKLEEERNNLITSLKIALNEIKTLKGILPICAYCHNIKDEEGLWGQMEAYISAHTDAKFSHGICPDCNVKVRSELGFEPKK